MSELIQDFHDDEMVFRIGVKPLSKGSVAAAYGHKDRVVPVAAAHLTREIPQDFCRSGSRIDASRSALNRSMLADVPMRATAIKDRAIALMEQHHIDWRSLPKNRIMAVETIISLPPGFAGDVDAFHADSLHWTEYTAFGHQVPVIAAILHFDEMNAGTAKHMAAPHLHVLTLPITLDGRMDGHDLVGFTGKHQKRNDSFYEHVGRGYGLNKPKPKVSLRYAERAQLADRLLAKFVADCPSWACNPAAMKVLRTMFVADPLGMARAHGIVLSQDDHQVNQTAYMRSAADVDLLVPETDRMPVNAVNAGMLPNVGPDGAQIDRDDASPSLPQPIHIIIADATPADEPPERVTRVRDADLPADAWNGDLGEHILPPPAPPSRRSQVLLGVRVALDARLRDRDARVPQITTYR